jgi:uracil-DNA glycosylase
MDHQLPEAWAELLADELSAQYFGDLKSFVEQERAEHEIYPHNKDVFNAFQLTSFEETRVLILGQDPYHGAGQAHGLCFSVQSGIKVPPSLKNIYKELNSDLGHEVPSHGHLAEWAREGVLMLNTVLTVRASEANSHRKKGWEQFTDAVISAVNEKSTRVVFVLWGKPAQKKLDLIDTERHVVVQSAHPSPLSARTGFFGSRPFSQINQALVGSGQESIDWTITDE